MKCFVKLIYIVCMSAYNTEHILVPGKKLHNAFTREKRITKVKHSLENLWRSTL